MEGIIMTDEKVEDTPQTDTELEKAQAEIEKWKALSRKNEAQAKENLEKAKRLDEIEEANKTELQKLQDALAVAEKKLKDRDEADALKSVAEEVAKAKSEGLDKPIPASALRGSTKEELEAHADAILALLPAKPKGATPDVGGDKGDPVTEKEAEAQEIASKVKL